MQITNVFYRFNSERGTKIISLHETDCNLADVWNHLSQVETIIGNQYLIAYETKIFRSDSCQLSSVPVKNDCCIDILVSSPGGKGGFGSLLRAIGAQIEKTTNRDACRDLQGRRLRDVKRQDELKKLIALQETLLEEKKRRKQEKLDKLRKSTKLSSAQLSIQELISMFDDHEYNKRRHSIGDIIEAAVDKGLINSKKRKLVRNPALRAEDPDYHEEKQSDKFSNMEESKSDQHLPSISLETRDNKHNRDSTLPPLINKNHLWLGLDSDEDTAP